jgi:hypothetical protein
MLNRSIFSLIDGSHPLAVEARSLPYYFLSHLSHRIFGSMHRVLNVGKKIINQIFGRIHGVLNVGKKITNCTVCL